uniref:Ig-like domain-containing protein n=1 Tax=Chelonoidis abingdonii TaxID=106734 RepID=A0A8C0IT96_CHEAB
MSPLPAPHPAGLCTDGTYPKPNISGIPSRVVSLGAAVTIRCEGQHQGMRFLLNKEGRHFPPVDSGGFVAEFLIRNVSREDGGSYNCSYHSRSEPFNVSYPSDPMELVVRGEGPSSPHKEREKKFFFLSALINPFLCAC